MSLRRQKARGAKALVLERVLTFAMNANLRGMQRAGIAGWTQGKQREKVGAIGIEPNTAL
jgi:hypothetical protein